jgi:hypothetical protein
MSGKTEIIVINVKDNVAAQPQEALLVGAEVSVSSGAR